MPVTTVTINGTDYVALDRAIADIALEELTITFDGYDELTFSVGGCGPVPTFHPGMSCTLKWDGVLKFVGDIETVDQNNSEMGWQFAIHAMGLKRRADRVTITGPDGTGEASYNRVPSDALYVASDAGLTLGTMISRLLKIQENADRLNALGVGAYVSLSPPTLPAATIADLLLLDVVPPHPVTFSGEGILNHIEQEVYHWHPKYAMWVQPDGTIRFMNLFAMTRKLLTTPTEFGDGDPVDPPSIKRDTSGCYTAFSFIGVDVQPAILSVRDGTLDANWSGTDQTNWRYSDFGAPGDAVDEGTIGTLTSTSAVLTSSNASRTYSSATLSGRQAVLWLINPAGAGINLMEFRPVTANTAMTAGGTMTVNWSSGIPLTATGYTKYRLVMNAGGLVDVWRAYLVRDPSTGNTGLSTWIGSHLMPRFPKGVSWANNGKVETITSPVSVVQWSSNGLEPYFEYPMTVEIDRAIGGARMSEPAVKVTATGGLAYLKATGSPTTFANGLPYDIKVVVPYNRGALTARKPTSGYAGTAYTEDGIQRIKEVHLDEWSWIGDSPDIAKLAQEHLDTLQDAVITGAIGHHGIPSAWDVFTLGYALDILIPDTGAGTLKRWDNLPVRSVTIQWNRPGDLQYTSFSFSNLRRAFEGDDLYIHPQFAGQSALEMGSTGFDDSTGYGSNGDFGVGQSEGMGQGMGDDGGFRFGTAEDFGFSPISLSGKGNGITPKADKPVDRQAAIQRVKDRDEAMRPHDESFGPNAGPGTFTDFNISDMIGKSVATTADVQPSAPQPQRDPDDTLKRRRGL